MAHRPLQPPRVVTLPTSVSGAQGATRVRAAAFAAAGPLRLCTTQKAVPQPRPGAPRVFTGRSAGGPGPATCESRHLRRWAEGRSRRQHRLGVRAVLRISCLRASAPQPVRGRPPAMHRPLRPLAATQSWRLSSRRWRRRCPARRSVGPTSSARATTAGRRRSCGAWTSPCSTARTYPRCARSSARATSRRSRSGCRRAASPRPRRCRGTGGCRSSGGSARSGAWARLRRPCGTARASGPWPPCARARPRTRPS
mmetsp:Transcript_88230/g.285590  ORF Transcript_88230/g.285590 Transcript_88230/m.285590 type:complete len:254 (+) Transcript_88230:581-1342(+)